MSAVFAPNPVYPWTHDYRPRLKIDVRQSVGKRQITASAPPLSRHESFVWKGTFVESISTCACSQSKQRTCKFPRKGRRVVR